VRRLLPATAAVVALALLAGCSNKPPVISRVYARVIYQHDTSSGADSEGLSVFLVASDPNGMENLSSFYVIDDEAELFWKVDSTSWVSSTAEGETWIGSNTLSMPGAASVPAGDYRVVLQNAGGDTVEQTFTLAPRDISAASASYPAASVSGGAIKVSGPYDSYEIWAYGNDKKLVTSIPVTRKDLPLSEEKIAAASPALAQGFTFRVFANNARGGFGVVSGPYSMAAVRVQSLPGR
jgi:hypothetical protein